MIYLVRHGLDDENYIGGWSDVDLIDEGIKQIESTREYIVNNFFVDLTDVDIIIGYRADDSYFSFAESFVQNGLSLLSLNQALRLGKLGEQTVLISEKAFLNLEFEGAEPADKTIYYPKFITRDFNARETYRKELRNNRSYKDDIFVLDILREEMKQDDSRIQRIVSE